MSQGNGPSFDLGDVESFPCQPELVALFETLVNVMFCAKDAEGVYVEVNTAFVRRTGRTSKREVIGRRAGDLFAPERATHYEDQDRRVLAEGAALRDELELIRRPDGGLGWYLTTKLPVARSTTPIGLVSVSRDLQAPTDEGVAVESLQPLVAHVREHLREPLRVTDLADVVGCSTDQLDRRVRRVFGLSPKQYVLRVKVERAMELLSTTDAPLSDVAHEAGFYDQPDLSRRFARATGRTPAQFRSSGTGGFG
ncbi:MAG: AraC family transcriptional regulator [Actinomycetota bacterium]